MRVSVVINPVAGVGGGSLNRARRRAEQAFDLLTAEGAEPEILITERHGHARELAHGAVERGSRLVIAWGGDGTVNEVAAGLAFSDAALGIIPAGSGNGLARMLAMPADPKVALPRLVHGRDQRIDMGEANGRLFAIVLRPTHSSWMPRPQAATRRSCCRSPTGVSGGTALSSRHRPASMTACWT